MKQAIPLATITEDASLVVQGTVATTAIAFLQTAVLRMIPYSIPALVLLALDLLYGVKAAKFRGERARFSTAIRRTMTKLFSYLCWLILASTLALSFQQQWLEWLVLGLVYANEFASIIGNYLETKGLQFSFAGFYRWMFKKAGQHVGVEVTDEEAEEIIKPKPARDAKGRFIKKDESE